MAARVPTGASVADVGCGDGHLSAHLRAAGHRVVPVERVPGAAQRARARLGDCRLGDGLTAIAVGEVEVAVIAGMGGHRIRAILEAAPAVARALDRVIIQPQQHAGELRAWLASAGFETIEEAETVDRRRRYTVLVVRAPR